jgi:hypothetical protein
MGSYYVYAYRSDENSLPFYIGKGVGTRAWDHLDICYWNRRRPSRFHKKLKAMIDVSIQPVVEIVAAGLEEHEALTLEAELIGQYGRHSVDQGGVLLNILPGGENPPNHKGRRFTNRRPPSTKGKPGRAWSEEDRKRHSELMRVRMSDSDTRQKCSAAKLGKPPIQMTNDVRAKISAAIRGSKNPKGSAAKRGARNPMFGRKWFNDGTRSTLFHPDAVPTGWSPGKLRAT